MIHITEEKLRAAIQIALVGECESADIIETKLVRYIKALSIAYVSSGTLNAKEATLEILEWLKSDDCWITDKDGNKLPDAIIYGKNLNKRLNKYYK